MDARLAEEPGGSQRDLAAPAHPLHQGTANIDRLVPSCPPVATTAPPLTSADGQLEPLCCGSCAPSPERVWRSPARHQVLAQKLPLVPALAVHLPLRHQLAR